MYSPQLLLPIGCVALSVFAAATAPAITLDWDAVSWTAGSLSNSYDVDGNALNGNDITITITGNTNKLTTDPATGIAAPSISNSLEGGYGGLQKSLILAGNLSTQTNFTVTVTFTGQYNAASGVSFKLFDIDLGSDHEQVINITGSLSNGTQVAPTITGVGSAVALAGTGLTQTLTGNAASPDTGVNSANGNATIGFGPTAIRSFSFDFKNDAGPPRFQSIALFDIDFTPVPEVNPAWAVVVVTILAACYRLRRRCGHYLFSTG